MQYIVEPRYMCSTYITSDKADMLNYVKDCLARNCQKVTVKVAEHDKYIDICEDLSTYPIDCTYVSFS